MLNFWYSERCSRPFKLMVIIVTCILIYATSTLAQLSPVFVVVSLGIGMAMHVLRGVQQKISPKNPYAEGFRVLSNVIPLIALITLFGYLPKYPEEWTKFALGLQCLGFSAIGLFMLSIYASRAKRFES